MISSQFKHPQVHVSDGVEGPAGQQDHFGYILALHAYLRRRVYPTREETQRLRLFVVFEAQMPPADGLL